MPSTCQFSGRLQIQVFAILILSLASPVQSQELDIFDAPKHQEANPNRNESRRERTERKPPAVRESGKPAVRLVLRTPPSENVVVFHDEAFKREFEAFDEQFRRKRRELAVEKRTELERQGDPAEKRELRRIDSCLQLASLPAEFPFQGTTTKYLPDIEYPDCFALAVARFGKRSKQSFFDHDRLGDDIFKTVKVFDLRSELSQLRTVNAETMLKDVPIHALEVSRSTIQLKHEWGGGNGMTYRIAILASADFDDDGLEDLLAMYTERSWLGSALLQVPIVISRKTSGGKLEFKDDDFLLTCLRSCQKLKPAKPVEAKSAGD